MSPDQIRNAAAEATSLFHQLLQSMTNASPIWPVQGADDGSSLLMPALAGLAALVGLSVLAVVIYDVHNAKIAHIAKTPIRPAVQFESQWRTAMGLARTLVAEMDRTTRPALEAHQG